MVGQEHESGCSLPNSTDAAQQHVEAVTVIGEAQLTAELAQPQDGRLRPGLPNGADELSRQQNQAEEPPHTFECFHAHVFDVEALFLIEAITMLDQTALAPITVDLADRLGVGQRDVGQQDQVMLSFGVVGHQHPQRLVRLGQANFEPTKADQGPALGTGMGEDHFLLELKRDTGGPVIQQLTFPTLQARIEDFHPAIVRNPKDKFSLEPFDLRKDFLVVQA